MYTPGAPKKFGYGLIFNPKPQEEEVPPQPPEPEENAPQPTTDNVSPQVSMQLNNLLNKRASFIGKQPPVFSPKIPVFPVATQQTPPQTAPIEPTLELESPFGDSATSSTVPTLANPPKFQLPITQPIILPNIAPTTQFIPNTTPQPVEVAQPPIVQPVYQPPVYQAPLMDIPQDFSFDNPFDDIPPPPPDEDEPPPEPPAEPDETPMDMPVYTMPVTTVPLQTPTQPIAIPSSQPQPVTFQVPPMTNAEYQSRISDGIKLYYMCDDGNLLSLTAGPDYTVLDFLSDIMLELLDHVNRDDILTADLQCADHSIIYNDDKLCLSPYIRNCVATHETPRIVLAPPQDELAMLTMSEEIVVAPPTKHLFERSPTSSFGSSTLSYILEPTVEEQPQPSAQPDPSTQPTADASPLPSSPTVRTLSLAQPPVEYKVRRAPGSITKNRTQTLSANMGTTFEMDKATRRKSFYSSTSKVDHFTVRFHLPVESHHIDIHVGFDDSFLSIKKVIADQVRLLLNLDLGAMEKYNFKIPGATFVNEENQFIHSVPYVVNCLLRGSTPAFVVLDKSSAVARHIKKNQVEIARLIGQSMNWSHSDDEITALRQSMTRMRQHTKKNQKVEGIVPSEDDLPVQVGETAAVGPNGTLIQLRLEHLQVKKTVKAFPQDTAADFIKRYYEKHYGKLFPGKSWEGFVLKATGFADYIHGNHLFHSFDFVRECIGKSKPIDLSLIERPNLGSKSPRNVSSTSPQTLPVDVEVDDESLEVEDPTMKFSHSDIVIGRRPWKEQKTASVWDINRQFRFRVVGVENLSPSSDSFKLASGKAPTCEDASLNLYLTAELYNGDEQLCEPFMTTLVASCSNPRWYEWAKLKLKVNQLPRSARLCFTLWATRKQTQSSIDVPLAWVNFLLFDFKNELKTGSLTFNMWLDEKANPIGTTVQNNGNQAPSLHIDMDVYMIPVVYPTEPLQYPAYPIPKSMENSENNTLQKIINSDPLYRPSEREKHLIWKYREFLKKYGKALPKFLLAVPKTDYVAVQEMHRLLEIWEPIPPIAALELLDAKFADAKIREYAVKRLKELSSEEVLDYLLQMVQALKYEPHHDTAFARFLLSNALSNQAIGHHFFWFLKSEIHVPEVYERFSLLLEAFLRGCDPHQRNSLQKQDELQQKFVIVANDIKKNSKDFKPAEVVDKMREDLIKSIQWDANHGVTIPLNPKIEVNGLKYEKCKYMDSKKMPLWLVFKNADPQGADPYVIFKSGDDLRQDMLTLQMIRIMDKLWKKAGLDLLLNPYGCISTGDEVGMIEVVLNSMTTAAITRAAGGAAAAFKEDPLANWLREHNPTDVAYKDAVGRFMLSCAGYCVATYVLGIGDRHNDNIMCTRDGRLFHIDFGHFLGNFKKKFGVKRERAPFVFTPDFAYVLGGKDGKDFQTFMEICCKAYNLLRKHANLFINLFEMMLSTGIPELRTAEDIEYIRDAFSLDYNDTQAAEKFKQLIYESLYSRATQINNAIHILAH